jgi:Ca2+-transporting ATPase
VILARCASIRASQRVEALTASDLASMLQASARMANDALRVLALAERPLPHLSCVTHEMGNADDIERGLTLLGAGRLAGSSTR